ncbi:MAG: tRNA pseudouridine(55) synthase TruB, partial [Spirochaetaceae bacterium]|nr:tRNA pseudouridine(55) synthase TruB [Spirochaetaceae bacterium]
MQQTDGIVLYAKQPGLTSFSSLWVIKHALNTTKIGHTGTLDNFADGLLVVCAGRLTRLAGAITAFNKDYEAIIAFGAETDTLDPSSSVTKNAPLPVIDALKKSIEKFTGEIMQSPPAFSALHINGKRASDLARAGKAAELPARPVTVYKAELKDVVYESEELKTVKYAHVAFSVSKGTYIRCLARDIASDCGSAAHLIGLRRTKVGDFDLRDASGFSLLDEFSIENVLKKLENAKNAEKADRLSAQDEKQLVGEITGGLKKMSKSLAVQCGFFPLNLKTEYEKCFFSGQPMNPKYFSDSVFEAAKDQKIAVFSEKQDFCGMIHVENKRIVYDYVINP